ncbi:MAG TPA: antitoxin family protein [Blastocatellia bacterium]|jgi:hypothetical protein|nr:antitoxin family protein [Blastocatellia bacterium]
MSKEIEAIFRNGRIELPPDVQLSENTRVRVIVPENAVDDPTTDPAYGIPDLADDVGPEDLARNFGHYLYGHPKQ